MQRVLSQVGTLSEEAAAEAGAEDKVAVLARARADAALISIDALAAADEVEDAF